MIHCLSDEFLLGDTILCLVLCRSISSSWDSLHSVCGDVLFDCIMCSVGLFVCNSVPVVVSDSFARVVTLVQLFDRYCVALSQLPF